MKRGYTTIIQGVESRGVIENRGAVHQRRPQNHGSKLLLCIWWDQQGVIYYELLKTNETITGGSLSTSVDAFESTPKRKTAAIRAETRQSDFVTWQRSASCRQTSESLPGNASVGSSTPPDTASSDFHLFRSMAHGLADRRCHSYEEARKWIDSWTASKDMSFFRRGIDILPERWEKVVPSDGQYLNWNVFVPHILNKVFILWRKNI